MRRLLYVALILLLSSAWAKGTLTIAVGGDAPTLDPNLTFSGLAFIATNQIYDTLVRREDDGLKPRLATRWSRVNATTWRFELRRGVKFHDGTPFNAQAVKFSVERLIDPASKAAGAFVLSAISTVRVVDEHTVEFVTAKPFAPLLAHLSHPVTAIVSPAAVQKFGRDFGRNPVGTGAFRFVSWKTGDQLVVQANPDYWGGPVDIDQIVFRTIPEVGTQVVEIKSGRVDLIYNYPPERQKDFDNDPKIDTYRRNGWGTVYLGFNTQNGITKDVRVRRALSLAIDRDNIVNVLRAGFAVKANGFLPPAVSGHSPELRSLNYNLAEAKKLLEEAGVAPGTRIALTTFTGAETRQIAEAVQFSMQQLGLNVSVQISDFGAFSTAIQKPDHSELFIGSWGTVTLDADYALWALFNSREIPANNWSFYKNSRVDALLLAGRQSANQPARLSYYREAQAILLRDLPVFPLYWPLYTYAKNNRLQGERFNFSAINFDFSKATLK